MIAGLVAHAQLKPPSSPDPGPSAAPARGTGAIVAASQLVLSAPQVTIGESYFATASGFTPREPVRLSWTGPTWGVMDVSPADSTGRRTHGPIIERDPPGRYTITATGLSSGRTASAQLEVQPTEP
jgi:hypothetical protein